VGPRVERSQAVALVGRGAELETLREALAELPAPRGIVLEGKAGIGKTALWLAGGAEAETRGLRVVTARPVEAARALARRARFHHFR
jgi:DNA replication protein DnaC